MTGYTEKNPPETRVAQLGTTSQHPNMCFCSYPWKTGLSTGWNEVLLPVEDEAARVDFCPTENRLHTVLVTLQVRIIGVAWLHTSESKNGKCFTSVKEKQIHFKVCYHLVITTSKHHVKPVGWYICRGMLPSRTTIWGNVQDWNGGLWFGEEWLDGTKRCQDAAVPYEDVSIFLTLLISSRRAFLKCP